MKYIITENQQSFVRRYGILKELIDEGVDVLSQDDDFCVYDWFEFLEEVCWQVSDKVDLLHITDTNNDIRIVHRWVRDNFTPYIQKKYNKLRNKRSC
jgi:hypothetical protein